MIDEDRLNRLSNIKAIGWSTMVISGLVTLYVSYQLFLVFLFKYSAQQISDAVDQPFNETMDSITEASNPLIIIYIITSFLTLLTTISSVGLIKLKYWGIILFHSFTISFIIGLLVLFAFYISNSRARMSLPGFDSETMLFYRYSVVGDGILILLAAWLLTRVNIILWNKKYRLEFN